MRKFFKYTYGISSGRTSAMMLIESVFALEVGAAANKIFSNAIMYCGRFGNIPQVIQNSINIYSNHRFRCLALYIESEVD